MENIIFTPLQDIPIKEITDLMNNKAVGKYLPLLEGTFTLEDCKKFLKAKQRMWDAHGFGPWAFIINGEFAGWGGLQPEDSEADFALVLHPKFWGWGLKIFRKVRAKAFDEMGLTSITALLPPGRHNKKAITRLGFTFEREITLNEKTFLKFRLKK